ncbi:MAG: hypothetical protein LBD71_07775 [Treponema sp.]|jgi:hypothetical protein|nr:hypothetical protein [Treponema sp.]
MKFHAFFGGIFLTVFFTISCVSTINNAKLNIDIDNMSQAEILPLKNNNNDIILYNMGSRVMEQSGFLDGNGQEYGYYTIEVTSYNDYAPNFSICGWINGLTLFLPSLIGFPTDLEEFDITAYLYIFDSGGTMIKVYKNSNSFIKLAGLYYGQNPDKKASKYYSLLFRGILEQAGKQSDEINYLLNEAGPITNENMHDARLKMTDFLKLPPNKR